MLRTLSFKEEGCSNQTQPEKIATFRTNQLEIYFTGKVMGIFNWKLEYCRFYWLGCSTRRGPTWFQSFQL